LHSDAKIEVLYKSAIIGTGVFALAYAFFGGIEFEGCTLVAIFLNSQCPTPIAPPGFLLPI
jgi:hypothetical protein